MRKTLILLAVGLAAAACSQRVVPGSGATTSAPSTASSSSPTATASPAETTQVTVYYLVSSADKLWLAPERHRVRKTQAIAKSALEELVHGTAQDPDHSTPYPPTSTINSVVLRDRVATVDWSADVLTANAGSEAERLGIQSVVYTLTEFSTISRVRFTVEGKDRGTASNGRTIEDWWGHVGLSGQPWDRDPSFEVLEPVTLWTPLQGAGSTGTIRLTGEATTFEANVGIILRDATGRIVKHTSATASEGAPGRGTFTTELVFAVPATAQTWTVQVFEASAKDGSVTFMEDRSIRVG